jgi:hypothetical protein
VLVSWLSRSLTALVLYHADTVDISRRPEDFISYVMLSTRAVTPAVAAWRAVWRADSGTSDEDVWAASDPVALWNSVFSGFHTATMTAIPPFVTVLGPSVLSSPDGVKFYTPDMIPGLLAGDSAAIEMLRVRRRQYLDATFAASSSAPSNYPLHATVRAVMLKRFPKDLDYSTKQAEAVIASLSRFNCKATKTAKGNLYTRDFAEVVTFAVTSFLAARRALIEGGPVEVKETGDFVPLERLVAVEIALLGSDL